MTYFLLLTYGTYRIRLITGQFELLKLRILTSSAI